MAQMTPHPIANASGSARTLRMILAAAVTVVFVLSASTLHAGAQTATPYPPVTNPPTTLIIDPTGGGDDNIIEAGEPVTFEVGGFLPGSEVCFYIEGELIGCDIADENGFAEFEWTVPAGTGSGEYDLSVEGLDPDGDPITVSGTFQIEANGAFVPGDGSGPLPYTGSDTTTLVRIAVVLLLAGGVSVVAMRRRGARVDA